MTVETMEKPQDQKSDAVQRDRLVFMGDGAIAAPYSLVFSASLLAQDVRTWLALRILYEHQQQVSHADLCEHLNASAESISTSLAVLDMSGWIVIQFDNGVAQQPIVADQRLSLDQSLQYNPGFVNSVKRYSGSDIRRVSEMAKTILAKVQV